MKIKLSNFNKLSELVDRFMESLENKAFQENDFELLKKWQRKFIEAIENLINIEFRVFGGINEDAPKECPIVEEKRL